MPPQKDHRPRNGPYTRTRAAKAPNSTPHRSRFIIRLLLPSLSTSDILSIIRVSKGLYEEACFYLYTSTVSLPADSAISKKLVSLMRLDRRKNNKQWTSAKRFYLTNIQHLRIHIPQFCQAPKAFSVFKNLQKVTFTFNSWCAETSRVVDYPRYGIRKQLNLQRYSAMCDGFNRLGRNVILELEIRNPNDLDTKWLQEAFQSVHIVRFSDFYDRDITMSLGSEHIQWLQNKAIELHYPWRLHPDCDFVSWVLGDMAYLVISSASNRSPMMTNCSFHGIHDLPWQKLDTLHYKPHEGEPVWADWFYDLKTVRTIAFRDVDKQVESADLSELFKLTSEYPAPRGIECANKAVHWMIRDAQKAFGLQVTPYEQLGAVGLIEREGEEGAFDLVMPVWVKASDV